MIRRILLGMFVLGLGFAFGDIYRVRKLELELERDLSVSAVRKDDGAKSNQSTEENRFSKIYSKLGLREGDTIYEINGVRVPQGFLNLVQAYDMGKLCVRYKRDGARKIVCYHSDASGEQVSIHESDR